MIQLEPNEQIVAVFKPHAIAYTISGALAIGVVLSAIVFFFPLLHLGIWGALIFCGLLIGGLLWLLRAKLMQRDTVIVCTDERIIYSLRLGLWGIVLETFSYQNLEISNRRGGSIASLLGLETLVLKAGKKRWLFPWVLKGGLVKELVLEVQYLKSGHAKARKTQS